MKLVALVFTILFFSAPAFAQSGAADLSNQSFEEMLAEDNLFAMGGQQGIDMKNWSKTPHISGRTATEVDVMNGNAIFFFEGNSSSAQHKPLTEVRVPSLAYYTNDSNQREIVVIIQAEQAKGKKVIGYRSKSGDEGACNLREVELISNPSSLVSTME